MRLKTEIIKELGKHLNNHNGMITKEDLYSLFNQHYHDLKDTSFRWYVHELKKQGILYSPQRGIFRLSNQKSEFRPYLQDKIHSINNIIKNEFNNINYCLWNTDWFNEFSLHQTSKNSIIVEVEKDILKTLFYKLQDNGLTDIYINPNSDIFDNYIADKLESIIVKPLITKSPLQKYDNIIIPKLEKMLVDLFCEKYILTAYQGYEMKTIFENVINNYNLNNSSLFNYVRRRRKEAELKMYLKQEGFLKDESL
jgi:hypothetical protein